MSDLQIPKRTELEKRLADALSDILGLAPPNAIDNVEYEQAIVRGHQALRRYNAKTMASLTRAEEQQAAEQWESEAVERMNYDMRRS